MFHRTQPSVWSDIEMLLFNKQDMGEISHWPARHRVGSRHQPMLDQRAQHCLLTGVPERASSLSCAANQPIRMECVEHQGPITHRLMPDSADRASGRTRVVRVDR